MTKTHNLKIQEKHFNQLLGGIKTFEVRFNDRDYQVGDILQFETYKFRVTDVFENEGELCPLAKNWVILSIKRI